MGWELTRGSLRLREVKGKTKKCMKGVGSWKGHCTGT
jgi:hypothetical protein